VVAKNYIKSLWRIPLRGDTLKKINQIQMLKDHDLFCMKSIGVRDGQVQLEDGSWCHDYITTGYLGVDRNQELINRGMEFSNKWGSISNWSRIELDPVIYRNLEDRIAKWMNCSNVILGHTITINNFSVMPHIAKGGYILCDHIVHAVVWESCRLARDHGAEVLKYKHQSIEDLEDKLMGLPMEARKIIAVDGVYSISSEVADIEKIVKLCEKYNAYVYVDDAHGLGIYGQRTNDQVWGSQGNGIWNFYNINKDRIFYVSNFGKAFGTTVAFLCYPDSFKEELKSNCLSYIFSAPPNPYSIGSTEAVMDWNERVGDKTRLEVYNKTKFFVDSLRSAGIKIRNKNYHPVVYVEFGDFEVLFKGATFLREHGIVGGYRAYPLVPASECGIRFSITNEHTLEVLNYTVERIIDSINLSKAARTSHLSQGA
jgi:8-amino-7-oxononanoate synthase